MDKKPKLLLVADTYYPKVDGTLRFMEEFIKRSKEDFELSLLVPNYGKKRHQNVTYLDVYKHIHLSGYQSIKFSFKNLKRMKKAIRETDLVFVQGPVLASYLSMYYGWRLNKRTVFYTHTLFWEIFALFLPPIVNRLFFNLVKKTSIFLYNRCDEVLVPYHELKDQLEDEGVKTKITVARLGVDIDKFSPVQDNSENKKKLGLTKDKLVIGYVGRISKEKNAQILLEAFSKLHDQDRLFLLMVGDGPESQTEQFKKIKNCKVTGFVDNVWDYLRAMDIFVMPSFTETTSLATLEAMSCGLPVIATKVGFIKRYIVKNHNGFFFPRNSPAMLAIKIDKLLKEPELRERLGHHARKTVAYSFSWERSINRIKRLLAEIVTKST